MSRILVLLVAFLSAAPLALAAKSPYDPVLTVNGDAITGWEISQRALFMKTVGLKGDLKAQARKALIDDRLKNEAAKSAGITVNEADLTQAMDDFASRGQLTTDQFRALLTREGVAWETFKSIISTSLVWRDVVRAKFASRVEIGDAEIDRALALADTGGLRVQLSEIVVPVPANDNGQTMAFLKDLRGSINSTADFARAARRYSAAKSRENGGKLDWMPLDKLPRELRGVILGMSPGEITEPIELRNGDAIFQLNAVSEAPAKPPPVAALEYMLVKLPATEAGLDRAKLMAKSSDQCSDIYGQTDDLPDADVTRETLAPDKIAPPIRRELARLDPGESSTRLRSPDGSQVWLVMLCGRSLVIPKGETRPELVTKLRNQRFEALANSYLDELRSSATVVTK